MREKSFLPTRKKDDFEFQTLGGMKRHQGNFGPPFRTIHFHDKRDVLQKPTKSRKLPYRSDQFLEIFQAAFRIWRLFGLPHRDKTAFFKDNLCKFIGRQRTRVERTSDQNRATGFAIFAVVWPSILRPREDSAKSEAAKFQRVARSIARAQASHRRGRDGASCKYAQRPNRHRAGRRSASRLAHREFRPAHKTADPRQLDMGRQSR